MWRCIPLSRSFSKKIDSVGRSKREKSERRARCIQHSWRSPPACNFFSSLLAHRHSSSRCKFEARIAERANVFPGWFSGLYSSPSLLILFFFVDQRTSEWANTATSRARAFGVGNRMGNFASIKCFTGAPNQRRAVDDDDEARPKWNFTLFNAASPNSSSFSRVHLTLAKYGQLVNRTRPRYQTSREL